MKAIKSLLIAAAALIIMPCTAMAFTDMPSGETGEALENAVNNGIITGYDDGLIKPDNHITRAEMAAMLTRCFGIDKKADISSFTDVSEQDWYYDAMSRAVAMGAFEGDDSKLEPQNNITFQEVFTVIARVFSMEDEDITVLENYSDADDVAIWAKGYTSSVVARGYWGSGTETLRPSEYITRGEFALLMDNIVNVYIDEPGVYTNETGGNIMVRSDGVTVEDPNGCELIMISDSVDGITYINNCEDLKYLVVRGGTVQPSGTVYSIRLAMPGTALNAADVEIDHGWGAEDTVVNFGDIGQ